MDETVEKINDKEIKVTGFVAQTTIINIDNKVKLRKEVEDRKKLELDTIDAQITKLQTNRTAREKSHDARLTAIDASIKKATDNGVELPK